MTRFLLLTKSVENPKSSLSALLLSFSLPLLLCLFILNPRHSVLFQLVPGPTASVLPKSLVSEVSGLNRSSSQCHLNFPNKLSFETLCLAL